MKKYLLLLLCCVCGAMAANAAKVDESKSITVGGVERTYILYVPDNVSANPALVFSLHGANGSQNDHSPFSTGVADSKGCIVVYPQGGIQDFGPFGKVPGWAAYGEPNEDLDFFKAIISAVTTAYPQIDKKRIYCCGFSNGGMMTYSNSNTASDIFAAFASISGYPINEMHLHHHSERPVPFLHIHGKSDDFVKYSLMGTIRDNMVARNGCNPVPTVTKTSTYTKSVYAAGEGGFPYIYYEVEGMGHAAGTDRTEDGNSTLTMWKFMSQYKLDDACDKTLKWNPNLDVEGFGAKSHGWTVQSGKTRFTYGDATLVQNVGHTLQFVKGSYQLRLETTGTAGHSVTIQLATVDGTKVFCKKVSVGGKYYIPFSVTPDFAEYTITIQKEDAEDKFVSLGAYMTTAAWTGATKVTSADVEMPEPDLVAVKEAVPFAQEDDETAKSTMKTADGVTTFTTVGGVEVVYKMLNVNVKGYEKVVVTLAEPTPCTLKFCFGETQDDKAAGTTSYTYNIPAGTEKLSEISLISVYNASGQNIKVKSVDLVKYVEEGYEEEEEEEEEEVITGKVVPFAQEDESYTRYAVTTSGNVTTFTAGNSDNVQVVYKMKNVDVKGYNKVVVTLTKPTPCELKFCFGDKQYDLPAGTESYTYDIPAGTTSLSEISLIALGTSTGTTVSFKPIVLMEAATEQRKNVPLKQTDNNTTLCDMSTSDGVTTFTIKNNGGVEVVYKMLNVNVENFEKVVVTFAEATPVELLSAFGTDQPTISQGATTYTYDIPAGTTTLSEISLIALWKGAGTKIKVKSVELVDTNGDADMSDSDDDVTFTDVNGENSTLFSLKKESFSPTIYAKGKYKYDAAEEAWSFYPGQYGFGGWMSEAGFDVSDYRAIKAEFAEAPHNGVIFRLFKEYNYWQGKTVEVSCDGKTEVSIDLSDIDRLYIAGFWAYGSEDASTLSMKLKRVTLIPYGKGDANKDGNVSLSDVPSLIDVLQSKPSAWHLDADGDGKVSVDDVRAMVDKLLVPASSAGE